MAPKKPGGRPEQEPVESFETPVDLEALLEEAPPADSQGWSRSFGHQTVLGPESIEALAVKPDGLYVDATLGGGGHSRLILDSLSPKGRLIAFDKDPEPIRWATEGWGQSEDRLTIIRADFRNIGEHLAALAPDGVDGVLADLGLNSRQLLNSGRGFSWSHDDHLDMRLDPDSSLTAWEVVNKYPEKKLADLIWRYGEERGARRVARGLVWARERQPIDTSGQLASIVARSLYRPGPPPRIHPATRVFMALRVEVNQELGALDDFLAAVETVVRPGGQAAVISFHSLEDRPVKEFFRKRDPDGQPIWKTVFKKALTAGPEELLKNPRARSAKLRAAIKLK